MALPFVGLMTLGACGEGSEGTFGFLNSKQGAGNAELAPTPTKLVERDVEAPEIHDVTDTGLWDGRPSLGGVWVAHPDVDEPERVIIRNTTNSKFVIGALFQRESGNPGPAIQVSSDAAAALGMPAGSPAMLNVTALRRETAPVADPAEGPAGNPATPNRIEAAALDPAAAIAARHAPQPSSLEKPYIQIGIFSVERNARNTATAMRRNGMVPIVKKQSTSGKTFWRVTVGPAATKTERSALLRKIEGVGFEDAYPVTN